MAGYLESTQRQKSTTKITISGKDLIQNWWRNQKFHGQVEVKRIQHHQTSLATNTKGIYIASKHKRKERPTKTNPPQIKKIPVGTCVSIITLNVNGLHALTKNAD